MPYPFCGVIDSERRSSRPNALAALINSIRTCARDHKDFGIYQSIFKQLRSVMKYIPALALPLATVTRFAVTLTTNAGAVCTFLETTHVLKEGKHLPCHCFWSNLKQKEWRRRWVEPKGTPTAQVTTFPVPLGRSPQDAELIEQRINHAVTRHHPPHKFYFQVGKSGPGKWGVEGRKVGLQIGKREINRAGEGESKDGTNQIEYIWRMKFTLGRNLTDAR